MWEIIMEQNSSLLFYIRLILAVTAGGFLRELHQAALIDFSVDWRMSIVDWMVGGFLSFFIGVAIFELTNNDRWGWIVGGLLSFQKISAIQDFGRGVLDFVGKKLGIRQDEEADDE